MLEEVNYELDGIIGKVLYIGKETAIYKNNLMTIY